MKKFITIPYNEYERLHRKELERANSNGDGNLRKEDKGTSKQTQKESNSGIPLVVSATDSTSDTNPEQHDLNESPPPPGVPERKRKIVHLKKGRTSSSSYKNLDDHPSETVDEVSCAAESSSTADTRDDDDDDVKQSYAGEKEIEIRNTKTGRPKRKRNSTWREEWITGWTSYGKTRQSTKENQKKKKEDKD